MIVNVLVMMALAQAPAGSAAVSGRVVDAEGRPAAGVEVVLSGFRRGTWQVPVLAQGKSGLDGSFRLNVPAEADPQQPHSYRAVWADDPKAGLAGRTVEPLPGGPVELKLGDPARTAVRVLGPDGKPIAGARVAPAWLRAVGGVALSSAVPMADALADRLAARTDADGKGEIRGCRAEDILSVRIDADGFGSQLSELSLVASGGWAVQLQPAGRLSGRVRGDDPSAARGLEVIAVTQPRGSQGLWPLGRGQATTGADGRFEFPAIAAGTLRLDVIPPPGTKLQARLPSGLAVEPGKAIEVAIAMEGPPRERTVTGRVVDRTGQPVPGATVFQSGDSPTRTEVTTGTDGRFALGGVIARPTFLFARKPGYRFAGLAIGPGSDDVTLSIHAAQEPPRLVRKTLPPPMSHEEELALARRLLDPYAEQVLKRGGEAEKVRTLEVLACVEPERTLELIQRKAAFREPFLNGMIGLQTAIGLMDEGVDEALPVLEALDDSAAKAIGFLHASRRIAARDRSRALEILDRALLNARVAKGPDGIQLLLKGQVAEGFLDLGQADRGRAILREGEAVAKTLPAGGWVAYARGAFAEELVQIDPDAALALTKDLNDPREFDRHHGNIAHELAGRDPARAERVLAMVKDRFQRELFTVRVVYRMAPLDLARARGLAGSIDEGGLKAYALGMMALRLAEAGKDSARVMLDAAYESLEHPSRPGREDSRSLYDPTTIAAVLLPVAERIDPGLVDESFWRSLAMRAPKPWDAGTRDRSAYSDVMLAMLLARYDRAVARSLVEPLARGSGPGPAYASTTRGELPVAVAMIDPRWAVALVEALPDDGDLKLQGPRNAARLAVAGVLGRAGERRYRKLLQSHVMVWVPDVEDHDPYD